MPDKKRAYIAENLPVQPVPNVPGIALHLAIPESGVWRLALDGSPPYWAWCWPGGLALAQYLIANPDVVGGKRVLDLGTGSGLVAITAANAKAGAVIACDIDPVALVAAALNAGLNGVEIETRNVDLLDGEPPEVACILVGDVFYEAELAARVLRFLQRCGKLGIDVLVGDIGRADLPRDSLVEIAAFPVSEFGEAASAEGHMASVYRLKLDA